MSTISAYQTSKLVFNEVFVNRNHITDQIEYLTHNTSKSIAVSDKETSWRLATDIQFLSILENQARVKSENTFAESVLFHLDLALKYLDSQLIHESFYTKLFSAFTAQNLIALTFVKKFNIQALKNKGYNQSVKAVNKYLSLFLDSAINSYTTGKVSWNTTIFGPNSGSLTYEQVTREKKHVLAPNGIKRFVGSLNVYALIGGALGLYGALLVGGNPSNYIHRGKIVDLGNLAIDMSANGNETIGHLNNIGGGRSDGEYISTGYVSWVVRGLAQMATGTTFELLNPVSMFMTEANFIKQGIFTVLENKGYMPDKFSDFYGNNANTSGEDLSSDKTPLLYELAWCGDQTTIDVMEKSLTMRHGLGVLNPIIVDCILFDEGGTSESYTHRALAGLTGGMIKGLNFNYASQFL